MAELVREHDALRKRLCCAEKLQQRALKLNGNILGIRRLQKHIKAEMAMLAKLLSGAVAVKNHHLSSTNLLHLEGVLHVCEHAHQCEAVERRFLWSRDPSSLEKECTPPSSLEKECTPPSSLEKECIPPSSLEKECTPPSSLVVDVVAGRGTCWVKVFVRKRSALHKKWLGEGNFGEKTVTQFAQDYVAASQQNLLNFVPPQIVFTFFDGITESIAGELQAMSVAVMGPIYPDDSLEEAPSPLEVAAMFHPSRPSSQPLVLPCVHSHPSDGCCSASVNMDISTLLAWVSSLTHGSTHCHFTDPVLEEQAKQELLEPLWPKLQQATTGEDSIQSERGALEVTMSVLCYGLVASAGRMLLACSTAVEDFNAILSVIGGPKEKERGQRLLAQLEVVRDCPSQRVRELACSGKIKPRAKIIFGTGDTLRAVTLTANEGFVRAAASKGVHINVMVHNCRALAEASPKKNQVPPDSTTGEDRSLPTFDKDMGSSSSLSENNGNGQHLCTTPSSSGALHVVHPFGHINPPTETINSDLDPATGTQL